jgi:hypothetical protein
MRRLLGNTKPMSLLLGIVLSVLPATRINAADPPATPDQVDLLFVQNSRGTAVDLEKHTLTLQGVNSITLFFSDRPVRIAGHYTTDEFLKLWDEGKDSFEVDPPNATLSVFEKGAPDLVNLVVKLKHPRLKGEDLTYDITVMEGHASKVGGPASLFIDFFVARRRFERAAVVYGAGMKAGENAEAVKQQPATQAAAPAASKPAGGATPSEKLYELKSLYNQGLISKSEYEAKKKEILNQIVQ